MYWLSLEFFTHYIAEGEDFLQRILIDDESWVCHWTLNIQNACMMWKTVEELTMLKFKERPSVRKIWPLFLGPVWSPVTRISSTEDDCHFSFIFWYPCQVANSHQGGASWTFELRSHFVSQQCVISHHQFDPNCGKKYEVGNFEAFTVFPGSRSIRSSHLPLIERWFGRKAF